MSKMSKKDQKTDYQVLYKELEARYGLAVAQEIVDQIKKIDHADYEPDYMPIKALSESLEIFRADAQKAVKNLKTFVPQDFSTDIVDLEKQRRKSEAKYALLCYWEAQHGFYRLYERAMSIWSVPSTYRTNKYNTPTKMCDVA